MRTVTMRCEGCGRQHVMSAGTDRPETWWLLEDSGRVMRTGPLDFCSLPCLQSWIADPRCRQTYPADWRTEE